MYDISLSGMAAQGYDFFFYAYVSQFPSILAGFPLVAGMTEVCENDRSLR